MSTRAKDVEKEDAGREIKLVIPCQGMEKKLRICEVCGHANSEDEAMCVMCSNYLFLERGV